MLRSSREGRKQAARFHAFTSSHHPSFASSRNSHKIVSPLSQANKAASLHFQRTARTLHSTTHTSSSLRQSTIESDSDSDERSSPLTVVDDADDSTNSSYTTQMDQAVDQEAVPAVEREAVVEEKTAEVPETIVEEDAVLPSFRQKMTPSRETTEEQSQSVSQYNSSPLSSPPTSHPDEDDATRVECLKNWQDTLATPLSAEEDADYGLISPRPPPQSPSWLSLEEHSDSGEPSQIAASRQEYRRFAPRSVEGEPMVDNRSQRRKVKTLKMKEAEETQALSPTSRKKAQVQASDTASSSRNVLVQGDESQDSAQDNMDFSIESITFADRPVVGKEPNTSVTSEGIVPVRRGPGRPRGSTKQKGLERRASEIAQSREASIASTASMAPAQIQEATPELESSTDSLTRRRSARRSEVARVSTPVEEVAEAKRKTVRLRLSLPNPPKTKSVEAIRKVPRVSKTDDTIKESASTKKSEVAGPSTESIAVEATETVVKPIKALWKRKAYLTSGLYSDDYKQDDPSKNSPRRKSVKDVPESLARGTPRTRKAHQVSALPLPIDYGLNLLEQQRDFRLPYPIAQEMQDIRDKLEAKKKPPPYKHISKNQYFSRAKLEGELLVCQCPPSGDCGDSCMNRLTEYLCNPKHCPCGDRCTNVYFGKRQAIKTEVQWYGARGFGLKTLEPIKKGGFIDEYRGEVIDFNEAVRRIRDHYKETGNYYFLMYDAPAGEMLDGGLKGNITRFANHSCDPNCKVQKWLVCGTGEFLSDEYQVALFAERDIEAGEELTYDYGWSAFAAKAVSGESNSSTPEVCHCGAAKCTGFLGVKKSAASTASEVVSKVLKRAKKKAKKIAVAVAESSKTKGDSSASAGTSALSTTLSTPTVKPATPSKTPIASNSKSSTVAPIKTTPAKLSRRGIMGQVLDGLISPASTLTSLSSSCLSDEDASELEKSVDTMLGSFDSEPMQRSNLSPNKFGHSLGKRKRYSARGSSPVEVANTLASGSDNQTTPVYARITDVDSTPPKAGPKNGRILLKDRVIRILVPNKKSTEPKPNLIIEGKRERKISLKAAEQDMPTVRRKSSAASGGELKRGASVDSKMPATQKGRSDKEVQSSPTPLVRVISKSRNSYNGLRTANGQH